MTRFVITNESGGYVFTNLPVGPYKLAAKLSGFSVFEQTGIVLSVGDTRSVNISLKVGALTEVVSVTADATLVESRDVGVSRVVEHEQIVGLPLNGRATQLIILAGGAVNVPGLTDNRQYPNAVSISVAGGTGNAQYLVDGGYNNDPQNNTGNVMPFPDALQEFSVESGVRSARFGSSTSAVNAVTRSGTNTFHGSAFVFGRLQLQFDSATSSAPRTAASAATTGSSARNGRHLRRADRPRQAVLLRRRPDHQRADRADRQRSDRADRRGRRGDFRRIMSAACRGGTAPALGAPFVDNQISPSLFNPISLKIMSMLPVPDPADPDGCGRYVLAIPNNSDEQQCVSRLDYQMSNKHRLFGRSFYTKCLHAPLFDPAQPNLLMASGNGGGNDARMITFAGGWDYIINPNLLSSTRVSYQDTATLRLRWTASRPGRAWG